eukprot:s421_g8.t1
MRKPRRNWRDLDARWLTRALGTSEPGGCRVSLPVLCALARQIPMRETNLKLQEHKKGKVASFAFDPPKQYLTAVAQQPAPETLHALPLVPSTPVLPSTNPVAPLQSPAALPPCPLPLPDAPASKQSSGSAASAAARLQVEMQSKGAADAEKKGDQENEQQPEAEVDTVKRPTESAKKKVPKQDVVKKPKKGNTKHAKQGSKETTSAKQVKKVETTKKSKEKKKTKEDHVKEDYNIRRNAGIPVSLLRKHVHGCGKCRSRPYCTPSCWALRGFTL